MRFVVGLLLVLCCAPVLSLAQETTAVQNIDLTIVLNAVQDCQPECAMKQFNDFKNNLDDYFDQHKGCREKFNMYLKQKKRDLTQWYSRECIVQCMNVIKQEFADDEDVKGQIGSGAFGFWASKGAIMAVGQICAKEQ